MTVKVDLIDVEEIYRWGEWYLEKSIEIEDYPLNGLGKWTIEFANQLSDWIFDYNEQDITYEQLRNNIKQYLYNDLHYFSDGKFIANDLINEYMIVPKEIEDYLKEYEL